MIDEIVSNPIVQFIAIVFTFVGLPLAIYSMVKGPSKRRFSCYIESINLIRQNQTKFEKIKVMFKDKEVENLSITNFTLWNSGKLEIRKDDLAKGNEIKITAQEGISILDARIVHVSEISNLFSITNISANAIQIDFDYVNENDGAVIEIVHTGTSKSLLIDCKLKGGKGINTFSYSSQPSSIKLKINDKVRKKIEGYAVVGIIALFMLFALFTTAAIYNENIHNLAFKKEKIESIIALAVGLWLNSGAFLLSNGTRLKRFFGLGIPSSLKPQSVEKKWE